MASMNNITRTSGETLSLERALFLAGCIAEASKVCDNKEAWEQKRFFIDKARAFLSDVQKSQEARQENWPDYDDNPAEAKAVAIIEDVLSRQHFRY